ncbi:Gfo/Idh/MocA family oxidoreductase [Mariniblastus sp.]|nr:Gfo/Idh/MocA family oxidoreductase [Mariniblastus sp.]MDB2525075.1 Gfo/Idh/MocA family oxidoreductase [Mariniblastus sp.]
MTKLRVAVIGAGHLGRIHTRLLKTQSEIDLVAVADPSPAAQQQIIDEFGVNVVSDYRKLIDQIDAAVIATPTRMHFEIAQELLNAKVHTLIEKPLTDSVTDANDLVKAAESNGCVVQVGHVEQFNPAIKSALGLVGQPKFIQASRMSGYTFRSTDIGVVHDLMIHDIDLINSMFEGELVETRATGVSMFGHNEDIAHARLQFSCGGVANLTASRCSFEAQRSFQIFGTDGFANADLATNKVTFVKVPTWIQNKKYDLLDTTPEQQAFIRENLFSKILPKSEIEVPQTNAILAEQQDWLDAIRTSQPTRVSVQQGAEAVKIADSVINSINAHSWSESSAGQPSSETMPQAPPTLLPFPLNADEEQRRRVA